MDFLFPIIWQRPNSVPQYMGTGCYISATGLFVTATHVAEVVLRELPGPVPGIRGLEPPEFQVQEGHALCLYHKARNVQAVQRGITNFFPKHREGTMRLVDICVGTTHLQGIGGENLVVRDLCPLMFDTPEIGTHITSFNYTNHSLQTLNDESMVFTFETSRVDGEIVGICQERKRAGHPYCRVRIPMNPGDSGSPVFNNAGQLVGVCSQSDEGDRNEGWMTPLSETLNIRVHSYDGENPEAVNTVSTLMDLGII